MEDLSQVQEQLNAEFKQRKRDELKTPEGFKKAVGEQVGRFLNKLMMKKNYQAVLVIILAYVFGSGLWFVLSHLFSWITVIVIGLCLLVVYWGRIKSFIYNTKIFIQYLVFKLDQFKSNIKQYIGYKLYLIINKIRGIFKRKK